MDEYKMEKKRLAQYEPFWDKWYLDGFIGEGNFASVYKIRKEENGVTSYAALKVISIPKVQAENRRNNGNHNTLNGFFKQIIDSIEPDIKNLLCLKGKSNIIAYEDYLIIERESEVGYDILLRMELTTNIMAAFSEEDMSNKEIIKLGRDLCWGLFEAHKEKIFHMDIKPENIFVSQYGDYSLGDFFLAKRIESFQPGLFKNNSKVFTAPEVIRESKYGIGADIYGVGVILHVLLNDGMIVPEFEDRSVHSVIPKPVRASDRIYSIVEKAISYQEEDRYESAEEFFYALSEIKGDDFLLPQEYQKLEEASGEQEIEEKQENSEDTVETVFLFNQQNISEEEKKQEDALEDQESSSLQEKEDSGEAVVSILEEVENENSDKAEQYVESIEKEEETLEGNMEEPFKEKEISREEELSKEEEAFKGDIKENALKEEISSLKQQTSWTETDKKNDFWDGEEKQNTKAVKKKNRWSFWIVIIIAILVFIYFVCFHNGITSGKELIKFNKNIVTVEPKTTQVVKNATDSAVNVGEASGAAVTATGQGATGKSIASGQPVTSSSPMGSEAPVSTSVVSGEPESTGVAATTIPGVTTAPDVTAGPTPLVTIKPLKIDKENKNIPKISDIKQIEKATELVVSQNQLKSMDGIEKAKNLILLDAGFNQIANIAKIEKLQNLEVLYLETNKIKNIKPLQELTKLKELSLMENELTDISSLSNLSELRILKLTENKIEDITVLGNLLKLEHLDLSGNPRIKEIEPLKKLINLKFLSISGTSITSAQKKELKEALSDNCVIY